MCYVLCAVCYVICNACFLLYLKQFNFDSAICTMFFFILRIPHVSGLLLHMYSYNFNVSEFELDDFVRCSHELCIKNMEISMAVGSGVLLYPTTKMKIRKTEYFFIWTEMSLNIEQFTLIRFDMKMNTEHFAKEKPFPKPISDYRIILFFFFLIFFRNVVFIVLFSFCGHIYHI